MKKVILSIVVAVGIVFSNIIYFEYSCITDEKWPKFRGFPFVQSTGESWLFSMSGDLFLKGLFGNVFFWALIIFFSVSLIKNWTLGKYNIAKWIVSILIILLALFITTISIIAIDWRLNWNHDNFKLDYYKIELDCERSFHFFN